MPLFFFAKLTSLMMQKEESNMKTFYALIGVTVTIGTAWIVGIIQGGYTVAKVCGVSRDTDLGDKLNDMVEAFRTLKGAVKEDEHDMLS